MDKYLRVYLEIEELNHNQLPYRKGRFGEIIRFGSMCPHNRIEEAIDDLGTQLAETIKLWWGATKDEQSTPDWVI